MKRQPRILVGTALGLLMASAPLMAAPPLPNGGSGESPLLSAGMNKSAPIVIAQAEDELTPSEELLPKKKHRKAQEERAPEGQPAEAAPDEQPRKKNRKEAPAAEQPAQQELAPAPAEEPTQPRKKNRKEAPVAEQPAQQELAPAPAEEPAQPRKKNRKEAPAAEQPAQQELAPAPAEEPAQPRKKNRKEAPVAEQPPQQELAPAPAEEPVKPRKKNRKEAPAAEQPAAAPELAPAPAEEPAQPRKKNRKEAPAASEQPATPGEAVTPSEKPAEATPDKPRKKGNQQAPAAEQPAAPGEAVTPVPTEKPAESEGQVQPAPAEPATQAPAPVPGEAQPAPTEATGAGQAPAADSQKVAPAPDSQKVAPAEGQEQGAKEQGRRGQREGGNRRPQPAEAGPPPVDDKSAQQEVQPEKVEPVTAEQGKRVKERPVDLKRRERPEGTEILKEFGDRLIIQLDNQVMVQSSERPRMRHNARDVYYEDLPRGRTRETIERRDGTRVVTIRNAYGDVVRRSRITPDGREYVLSYVDEDDYDRVRDWRDPGRDLPPLRLEIPVDDYILTSDRVRDPDMYYRFLEQPPVERVERLYSVDEVKRSARIRDKTRRIDLDTVTFDFGSATIAESEITRLEGVANAMERILDRNPAETFLIEGHTDAVGSDLANLALSDKRAEAVAAALTNVFGIPPENLATQGYGEQFLKVKTQSPERQNRRVAIRRITPLVAPVASNQ
ncbi:OmpA family protein [Mesorhizobium sp. KR2-14]|uniref:OmpA family protein n=1 Tax=Mesorhizobium sp. KR2-14 TaxID=3156610 RepID=UPI0032B5C3B0